MHHQIKYACKRGCSELLKQPVQAEYTVIAGEGNAVYPRHQKKTCQYTLTNYNKKLHLVRMYEELKRVLFMGLAEQCSFQPAKLET